MAPHSLDSADSEYQYNHIAAKGSKVLHSAKYQEPPPQVISAHGCYLRLSDGRTIFEACGGPGVACIGHGNEEVSKAVQKQMEQFSYCFGLYYSNPAAEELAKQVIESTDNLMAKAAIISSGSEAVEAAMKLAVKYYVELNQPQRTRFIARTGGFHGTTAGSLALTGKRGFRLPFEPLLKDEIVSLVSMPNTYRGMHEGETVSEYVQRLAQELDAEFERVGPKNVCAFVAETVSGSALGVLTPPPGYFVAIRKVCDKHGALLILDEVMCGMGRTGSYHAWQTEDVVPDVQTVAKGVAGGYAPVSMILTNQRVVDAINAGSGVWNHGHTFTSHPTSCAAGVAVQKIIKRDNLVANASKMGDRLGAGLRAALSNHPHVGDIRGRGMMWAIEFVQDRSTKEPFPPDARVSFRIHSTAMAAPWNMFLYPGTGSADGTKGDHIMIGPAYNITAEQVDMIVEKTSAVVHEVLGPSQ